jgi:predicted lipoprotein with Yx(FWY)xxD motif
MKASRFGIAVIMALLLVGVSTALASTSGPAPRAATVAIAPSGLGRILVDIRGHTLYLFEKDKRGMSACSGLCTTYWPPLLTNGKSIAGKGAKRSLLGSVRRADGTRQVTYAGHPLYLFFGDTKRGQTNGEGLTDFGASWDALSPAGTKIERD